MRTAAGPYTARRCAVALAFGVAVGAGGMHYSHAQQEAIKRTPLTKTDLTNVEGKEVLMTVVEAQPGATFPPHFHHGDEFIYVMEGALQLSVADRGEASPKAGELVHVPREKIHSGKAVSPSKFLSVHIVDKGKPFAERVKD